MKVLVAGGGGFIGGHLTKALIERGDEVRVVDLKPQNEWYQVHAEAENITLDLSMKEAADQSVTGVDQVFNLAADMGGMGFIENNKALCMLSSLINTHLLMAARENEVERYFYSSSACVYASWHQNTTDISPLKEADAYPADPEDGYGWEKLFGERLCRHFMEDFGIETRVARYHNVYGPHGTFDGGREKAPAAASRKIAAVALGAAPKLEMWGDGQQLRSFTYIDDCVEGTLRLMSSDVRVPLNIGSSQTVSIQTLYDTVQAIAGVGDINYTFLLDAPLGVRGRSSDNTLCRDLLGWEPGVTLRDGLMPTYEWILGEMTAQKSLL